METDALSKMQVTTGEKEITFVRMFDAPRRLVWDAWTKKEHLLEWWGPHGFTNSNCSVDLRKGGYLLITMNGADGTSYPCKFLFEEIVPPEKLVMTDEVVPSAVWGDNPPPDSTLTLLLEEVGGKTRMTIVSRFASNADRDNILKLGAADGWAQSFERLDTLLAKR